MRSFLLVIVLTLSLVGCGHVGEYESNKITLSPAEEKKVQLNWNKLTEIESESKAFAMSPDCQYGGLEAREKLTKLGIYDHSIDTSSLEQIGDTIDHPIGELKLIKKWSPEKNFFSKDNVVQLTIHDVMIVKADRVNSRTIGSLPNTPVRNGTYFIHIYFTIKNKTNEELYFNRFPTPICKVALTENGNNTYSEITAYNILPSFEVQYSQFTKVPPKEERTYSVLVALYTQYMTTVFDIENTKSIELYNSQIISTKSRKFITNSSALVIK